MAFELVTAHACYNVLANTFELRERLFSLCLVYICIVFWAYRDAYLKLEK